MKKGIDEGVGYLQGKVLLCVNGECLGEVNKMSGELKVDGTMEYHYEMAEEDRSEKED